VKTAELTVSGAEQELLTTFYIGTDYYGIEVMKVQEVTGSPILVLVPLAPKFVQGLVNLRGQLATALGLRELFGKEPIASVEPMSVVCRADGNLVALMVDSIGDVVEVERKDYDPPPDTIPIQVKKFIKGVYRMNGVLLSVLDLEKVTQELSPTVEIIENRQQKQKEGM
jgi:purine-binding chemotaxis protein CheW